MGDKKKKTEILNKKNIKTFITYLLLILVGQLCFGFINIDISFMVGLAISNFMLIKIKIAISFFELFYNK